MRKEIEPYIDDLKYSLDYIIKRNCDIDPKTLGAFDAEKVELDTTNNFIVFVNNVQFTVCGTMTVSDAKYISDNIDNISYVYSKQDSKDSIVGDIASFILSNISCKKYDSYYIKAKYLYIKYIRNSFCPFSKSDVLCYIEGEMCNEAENS